MGIKARNTATAATTLTTPEPVKARVTIMAAGNMERFPVLVKKVQNTGHMPAAASISYKETTFEQLTRDGLFRHMEKSIERIVETEKKGGGYNYLVTEMLGNEVMEINDHLLDLHKAAGGAIMEKYDEKSHGSPIHNYVLFGTGNIHSEHVLDKRDSGPIKKLQDALSTPLAFIP